MAKKKVKKEINIFIGQKIKEQRKRAGLSREKLAELIDITPRFVADVERGSVGISISTLKKACEVLNVSSDSLLWDNTSKASIDEKLKFLDDDSIKLIDKTVQSQIDFINNIKGKQ